MKNLVVAVRKCELSVQKMNGDVKLCDVASHEVKKSTNAGGCGGRGEHLVQQLQGWSYSSGQRFSAFCFENFTAEGGGGERGRKANFKITPPLCVEFHRS